MRVAVICGGRSAEREVSLRSGAEVERALRERGHEARRMEPDRLWDALPGFDCAFVALHGRQGEDGSVQGLLEVLGMPYTGCGILASALCIDKARAAGVLRSADLDTPDFREVDGAAMEPGAAEAVVGDLGLPLVVKPVREGSTIGLTIARDIDAVADGIALAARYDRRVLCQRFVAGVEVTVGVLGLPEITVLPTLEIVSDNPVYDYDAKYTAGRSHHIIPARIPEEWRRRCEAAAAAAFGALGCEGMARVDIIVDAAGTPWILEVNTIPGMTDLSLLPDAARAAGIAFPDLCDRLVRHALWRGPRGALP